VARVLIFSAKKYWQETGGATTATIGRKTEWLKLSGVSHSAGEVYRAQQTLPDRK